MEHEFALKILKDARSVSKVEVRQVPSNDYRASNSSRMVELASLTRIAGELHKLSRMERATSQPLKQDTRRLIDRSKRLVEKSRILFEQVAATRKSSQSP